MSLTFKDPDRDNVNVFAKIFAQIFDSSIASDHVVRHVFMDMIVLADRDGVVDMTYDAIARRTNVPEAIVIHAIGELLKPDPRSRSKSESGARLIPIDSHRDWGWQIVNFEHYRNIVDEESRRAYFRDKKREQRSKVKRVKHPKRGPNLSKAVRDSPILSTQAEAEAEAEAPQNTLKRRAKMNGHIPRITLTPDMMARGLAERLGVSLGYGPGSFNTAVTEVAAAEQKAGRLLEDLCIEMESAYRYYLQEKPHLRITWGPAKFFGDGHWRDPPGWPRKEKSRAERIAAWSAPDDDEGT